jgi:hypothetical protein
LSQNSILQPDKPGSSIVDAAPITNWLGPSNRTAISDITTHRAARQCEYSLVESATPLIRSIVADRTLHQQKSSSIVDTSTTKRGSTIPKRAVIADRTKRDGQSAITTICDTATIATLITFNETTCQL